MASLLADYIRKEHKVGCSPFHKSPLRSAVIHLRPCRIAGSYLLLPDNYRFHRSHQYPLLPGGFVPLQRLLPCNLQKHRIYTDFVKLFHHRPAHSFHLEQEDIIHLTDTDFQLVPKYNSVAMQYAVKFLPGQNGQTHHSSVHMQSKYPDQTILLHSLSFQSKYCHLEDKMEPFPSHQRTDINWI